MLENPPVADNVEQLIEQVVDRALQDPDNSWLERKDLVNALAREWLFGKDVASLHLGKKLYFLMTRIKKSKLTCNIKEDKTDWLKLLENEYHIKECELRGMIRNINGRYHSDRTNTEGDDIRWWVNPSKRSAGIDNLTLKKIKEREFRIKEYTIIGDYLRKEGLNGVDEKTFLKRIDGLVAQFDRYLRHAAYFTEDSIFFMRLEKLPTREFALHVEKTPHLTEPWLEELGVSKDRVDEVIEKINSCQPIHFFNRNGDLVALGFNPRECRVIKNAFEKGPR